MTEPLDTTHAELRSEDASRNHARAARICSVINAAIGAWIVISPWLLSGAAASLLATWVSVSTGACIAVLALARSLRPLHSASLSVANLLTGAVGALLLAEFGDFSTPVAWNAIAGLLVVTLLALRSALITLSSPSEHSRT